MQTLGFSLAGGSIKNKMADKFFAGATATASADALERGLLKLGINLSDFSASEFKVPVLGGAGQVGTTTTPPVTTPSTVAEFD